MHRLTWLVLLLAAVLRLYDLDNPRPGVYRDEVIEGLHGVYQSRGTVGTGNSWIRYSRVPLWELVMTCSVGLLGPTILALRLPAALCAVGAVWCVHDGLRRVAGRAAAVVGAGMLAGSFWNVLATRIGQPMALVCLQAGIVWWLAASSPALPSPHAALALGLVAASGIFTYFGALTLPAAACWLVWTRARAGPAPEPPARIVRALLPAFAGIAGVASLFWFRADLVGPLGDHAHAAPLDVLGGLARYLGVLVWPTPPGDPDPGFWGIYPRGWPLLFPAEALFALLGLLAWRDPGPGRGLAMAATGWIVLGLLPAAAAPGLVFHRPAIAAIPVALLDAAGWLWLNRRLPRVAVAAAAAALTLNAGWTVRTYFITRQADPQVESWADGVDTRVALDLKRRAAQAPLALANSLTYADAPWLAYLLDREIASGRVRQIPPPANPRWTLVETYREPLHHQPLVALFRVEGPGLPANACFLAGPPALLGAGNAALAAGDPHAAVAHFEAVLRMFPDYGFGWARLSMALTAAGSPRAAARARSRALELGIPVP